MRLYPLESLALLTCSEIAKKYIAMCTLSQARIFHRKAGNVSVVNMFVPVHRLDSIQIASYRSSQLRPVFYRYKPEIDHSFPRHRTIRTTQICRPAQSRPGRPTLKPRRRPTPSRQPLRSSLSPNSSISSSKPCLARRGLHFVKCRKHGKPPYRNLEAPNAGSELPSRMTTIKPRCCQHACTKKKAERNSKFRSGSQFSTFTYGLTVSTIKSLPTNATQTETQ
jgi:hypothetical protein